MASTRLAKAFQSGVVRVRNKISGEIMIPVPRPDPDRPGKVKLFQLLVAPLAQDQNLTLDATVEELRRVKSLDDMVSPPHNVLDVIL